MADLVTRNWADIARKVVGAVIGVGTVGTVGAVAGADQLVLWLWNGVFGFGGSTGEMPAAVATWIGALLSSSIGAFIGGWLPKESMPSSGGGAVLKSPVIVTTAAFALGLVVVLALSACSAVSANTWQGRIDGARSDLRNVGLAMVVYASLPPCGSPGVQGLCSSKRVLDLWDAGETTALAGLDGVEKLVKKGATEEEITAAWVAALAEVVRMQNLLRNSSG